jgi:hypothetical protein
MEALAKKRSREMIALDFLTNLDKEAKRYLGNRTKYFLTNFGKTRFLETTKVGQDRVSDTESDDRPEQRAEM